MANQTIRALLVVACVGAVTPAALADEVVHFTNGSEMAVRAHSVEKDMVRLDLGNNSFIAFPMSMVDKIVNSGQDVFLNPTFHPSNQAVGAVPGAPGAASASNAVPQGVGGENTTIRGAGMSVGFNPVANNRGAAGVALGEVSDQLPQNGKSDLSSLQTDVSRRRVFNPAMPTQPGDFPQVIMPPQAKLPRSMTAPRIPAPQQPAPQQTGAPPATNENPSQGDSNPQDSDGNN